MDFLLKSPSIELLLSDMATTMTHFNISQVNTDQNFETFTQTFINVFDKHVLIKPKSLKRETQPEWHNEDIKYGSKQRDMYHKSSNWSHYKYRRSKTIQLIRTAKKEFFAKSVGENKDNAYLWKHIKI